MSKIANELNITNKIMLKVAEQNIAEDTGSIRRSMAYQTTPADASRNKVYLFLKYGTRLYPRP